MLRNLRRYENLGTPTYFHKLLRMLQSDSGQWTLDDIRQYFFNRIVDGRSIFDGCIPLLIYMEVIEVDANRTVSIQSQFVEYLLKSEDYFNAKFVEQFFTKLKNDSVFNDMFTSRNISYDVIYRGIQIDNSTFPFKYANVKQLLIDFEFIRPHPDKETQKFIVNSRYRKIFDVNVLPEIKKRKVGIEGLQQQLNRQRLLGEEAERFVLKFEQTRLNSPKEPELISPYSPSAGYDIASYDNFNSATHDRFIEVKSFAGNPQFYWTRNEMDTARLKKEKYFLYLVDRDLVHERDYSPIIIKNPYNNVLRNETDWNKWVDKYFIYSSRDK